MAYLVDLKISIFHKLVKVKIKLKTDTGLHFFSCQEIREKTSLFLPAFFKRKNTLTLNKKEEQMTVLSELGPTHITHTLYCSYSFIMSF